MILFSQKRYRTYSLSASINTGYDLSATNFSYPADRSTGACHGRSGDHEKLSVRCIALVLFGVASYFF